MTWYLTIRSDLRYSRSTASGPLVEHLRTFTELVLAGHMEFRNAPESPWLRLVLARADEAGNYANHGDFRPTVNVVELICGDDDEGWYESLAWRIASFLGWEAVEEHTGRTIDLTG